MSVVYTAVADIQALHAGDDAASASVHPLDSLPSLAFDHAKILGDLIARLDNLQPSR
jgi:8-oxo-dGTP diphosphatase